MTKEEARYKLKIKRRYFQNIVRQEADRVLCETFLAAFGNYGSFLLYSGIGDEAGTDGLCRALLAMDKRVYLPRVEGARMVAAPYGELKKGAFGILEPVGAAYCGTIDVTVAPLLAVNANGYRLGYGKGYYDGYLKGVKTLRVGYGYDFQRDEFPEDEWDEPLDAFVSEKGVYYFER